MKKTGLVKLMSACLFMVMAVTASAQEFKLPEGFQEDLQAALHRSNSRLFIESINPSGVPGFYKVKIKNGPVMYVNEEMTFFFDGDLYGIQSNGFVNITETDEARERKALVSEFKAEEMIIFAPKPPIETKAVINVFTDVDCFYCQKLHSFIDEYNSLGIEVRYLAFPRAGIGSDSYNKVVSAWCSANPQEAITKLKLKQAIPSATCDNPVAAHYDLGKRMGVTGTPAIVLQDGTLIPGFRPPKDMAQALGL